MEYQFLEINPSSDKSTNLTEEQYRKYAKILNNLLGIKSRGDSSIFTKLSNENIDVLKIIKAEDVQKIFLKSDFKVQIKSFDISNLDNKMNELTTFNELQDFLSKNDVRVPKYMIEDLSKNRITFKNFKDYVFDNMINNTSVFLQKWSRYKKKVNESFDQTNIWPLYIGTFFIKGIIGGKAIHAPLIIKEVDIEINENKVYLKARDDSTTINDKLAFYLQEGCRLRIPNITNEKDKITLNDIVLEMKYYLSQSSMFEINNKTAIKYFNDLRVQNMSQSNRLEVEDNIVLFLGHPTGGHLRKATIELIKNDRIKNLINLDTEDIINYEQNSINNVIIDPKQIVRICQTDASQERAIINSLISNTIIIGPPGTGKSQTIANILANIMNQNKKALFISQKRVALEVVLERMKNLQYFTLQLVEQSKTSSKDEKKSFYKYLNTFVNFVKSAQDSQIKETPISSLVSQNQLIYWTSKDKITNCSQVDVDVFCQIKKEAPSLNRDKMLELMKVYVDLNSFNKLDKIDEIVKLKEIKIKELSELLGIKPKKVLGIFTKYDSKFKELAQHSNNFLDIVGNERINNNVVEMFKNNLSSFNNIYLLENHYQYHSRTIPKTNSFVSNEGNVLLKNIEQARKVLNSINNVDKTWARKFFGRVERQFTNPSKFISLFKNELKQLFNVVVSTPEALSSYVDFEKDKYDYVIFDEASQIFLEKAIPYLSIAKSVIIAGDDQQMQPSNWLGSRSDVETQEEQVEENIDSLLTYAIEYGIPKQVLELNYRSEYANLTTYSSKEFYNSNLRTLDKNQVNANLDKSIEVIDVEGKWVDQENEVEAYKMIDVLKYYINKYERIILLTLNKKQMDLVDYLLSANEPTLYNKVIEGELILKNLENIQGDEADLVIISVAYTKDSRLGNTFVGRNEGRNALNVAITRARSKMVVIKSIKSEDINSSSGELTRSLLTFKNWIKFLELSNEEQKTYSLVNSDTTSVDSDFEIDVLNWLKLQSFPRQLKIKTQYVVGSYRIDIALLSERDEYVLGIEVDGYRYHNSANQRYNDIIRQNFIEAKGYPLIRISELLWKTNKPFIKELIDKRLLINS